MFSHIIRKVSARASHWCGWTLKIYQNTYPRFSFTPKTGIAFPKIGILRLLWRVSLCFSLKVNCFQTQVWTRTWVKLCHPRFIVCARPGRKRLCRYTFRAEAVSGPLGPRLADLSPPPQRRGVIADVLLAAVVRDVTCWSVHLAKCVTSLRNLPLLLIILYFAYFVLQLSFKGCF